MKKKFVFFALMLLFVWVPIFTSCEKEGDDNDVTNIVTDNYYVKYEVVNGKLVDVTGLAYDNTERNIVYRDVDGTKTIKIKGVWDGTFGPFKKGDQVFLNVTTTGKFSSLSRISVSKNKEPFAVKADTRVTGKNDLSYVIDF